MNARDVIANAAAGWSKVWAYEIADAILADLGADDGPVAIVDGKVRRLELTGADAIASDLSQQPTFVLGPEVDQ